MHMIDCFASQGFQNCCCQMDEEYVSYVACSNHWLPEMYVSFQRHYLNKFFFHLKFISSSVHKRFKILTKYEYIFKNNLLVHMLQDYTYILICYDEICE